MSHDVLDYVDIDRITQLLVRNLVFCMQNVIIWKTLKTCAFPRRQKPLFRSINRRLNYSN